MGSGGISCTATWAAVAAGTIMTMVPVSGLRAVRTHAWVSAGQSTFGPTCALLERRTTPLEPRPSRKLAVGAGEWRSSAISIGDLCYPANRFRRSDAEEQGATERGKRRPTRQRNPTSASRSGWPKGFVPHAAKHCGLGCVARHAGLDQGCVAVVDPLANSAKERLKIGPSLTLVARHHPRRQGHPSPMPLALPSRGPNGL